MSKVKIYQVGGSVRDELLGIKSKDIDYAVEAESYEVMRDYLIKEGYMIFLETPEYFTIRAKFPKSHPNQKLTVDFSLCRSDGHYSDQRRPDQVKVASLMDDLGRRDFTVNAIAKDISGELIDPYDGQKDLERRLLRAVGSAEDRIKEDPLRVVRAVRFAITKGFKFDSELEQVIHADWLPEMLGQVSIERVREELTKAMHHDTILTMELLTGFSREFREAIFRDGLWLMPTNRK